MDDCAKKINYNKSLRERTKGSKDLGHYQLEHGCVGSLALRPIEYGGDLAAYCNYVKPQLTDKNTRRG